MNHCRLADLPDALQKEQDQILEQFMSEGSPDDDVTPEEVDAFFLSHASNALRAAWKERDAIVAEARARGAYAG